ncbi:MAG: saccharopine dehydrogenase C-terminal domain-containing protein [Paracoccaceae bacterium]|nr:saccharopine dehydrogenase C-terminal domain-containing protein [Paracoccaceae bacterium]
MNYPAQIRVLVLGAGRHGVRIAQLLATTPRFAPYLADFDGDVLAAAGHLGLPSTIPTLEITRENLPRLIGEVRAVIVTHATFAPLDVALAALAAGCVYLDILESPRWVAQLQDLAQGGGAAIAPGCGLAPGYVTALAAEALDRCGPDAEVTVFVGVLPKERLNCLGYANIWGIDGLIDEYTQPCAAIRDGACAVLAPLQDEERLEISGHPYEAFTTAGSLDGLTSRYAGHVRGLVFKTLRYPGHLDYVRFLLDDMGLSQRVYQFRSLLMTSLPKTALDRVLIALRVVPEPGAPPQWQTRMLCARTSAAGQVQSASVTATAAHVCAVLDVLTAPEARVSGWVPPGTLLPNDLRGSGFFDLLTEQDHDVCGGQDDQAKGVASFNA